MSVRDATGSVRQWIRRVELLGLAALLAAAAAVVAPPSPASAQLPNDLQLDVVLQDDSDNIVPPDSTVTVGAQISFTGDSIPEMMISEASMRLAGSYFDFEDSGRGSRAIVDQQVGSTGSLIGEDNAVQADFDHDGSAATDPVTLTVIGARNATAHGYTSAGAAYVFEGTELVATLTAGDSANAYARFGQAIDVANGVIVIGAPAENRASRFSWLWRRDDFDIVGPVGAVHVFEKRVNGDNTRTWQRVAKLMPVDHPKACALPGARPFTSRPSLNPFFQHYPITDFGNGVGISDDGTTIAVHARPGKIHTSNGQTQTCDNSGTALTQAQLEALTGDEDVDIWRYATGWVFSRSGASWTDMEINDTGVVTLRTPVSVPLEISTPGATQNINRHDGAYIGDLDISGNGQVVAIGGSQIDLPLDSVSGTQGGCHSCADRDHGSILIYDRGSGNMWSALTLQDRPPTAVLNATGDSQVNSAFMPRIGTHVALNNAGDTIVAGAGGRYATVRHWTNNPNNAINPWPGAALVWVKPSGAWANDATPNARLTDADSHAADLFGRNVAISDSGDRIVAGNESDSENNYQRGETHIYNKPGSGWTHDSAADIVLNSPQYDAADPRTYQLAFGSDPALDGENTLVVGQFERIGYLDQRWVDGERLEGIQTGPGRAWLFDLSSGARVATQASAQGLAVPISNCAPDDADGFRRWTCDLYFGEQPAQIVLPPGTPTGSSFTIGMSLKVNGQSYSASLPVRIDTVREVDQVAFGFAERTSGSRRGEQYPATISAGQTTTLSLSVLNVNGAAAARNSIASIIFTASQGALTTKLGGGCRSGGGLTCQLAVAGLDSNTNDDIRVTLEHPGGKRSGSTRISATVLSNTGETFIPEPITVTFAGPASAIAISKPATGLLSFGTCDEPDAIEGPASCRVAADRDNRDLLTLQVSATDDAGNTATVPTTRYRATITGPDGKNVPSSAIAVTWPLRRDGDDDGTDITSTDPLDTVNGAPQARLDVDAPAASQLANGEYTLELRAGSLRASQTFRVSGGPNTVTLSAPEGIPELNSRIVVTATVANAEGEPVPDGTAVEWNDNPLGSTQTLLIQLGAESTTRNGRASATYLVNGRGTAYVGATAGEVTNLILLPLGEAASEEDAAEAAIFAALTSTMPSDYSVWLDREPILASNLLAGVTGVNSVLLWQESVWVRYAVTDGGFLIPGSMDFQIPRGAILWLGE